MHEVHYVFRVAAETGAKFRILCRDTHWTSIQVADTHHDAAQTHERRRRKTKLFGAEQSCDNHVASGFQLAISFQCDAATKIIEDQSLMSLSKTKFPWHPGMLDAGKR